MEFACSACTYYIYIWYIDQTTEWQSDRHAYKVTNMIMYKTKKNHSTAMKFSVDCEIMNVYLQKEKQLKQ